MRAAQVPLVVDGQKTAGLIEFNMMTDGREQIRSARR